MVHLDPIGLACYFERVVKIDENTEEEKANYEYKYSDEFRLNSDTPHTIIENWQNENEQIELKKRKMQKNQYRKPITELWWMQSNIEDKTNTIYYYIY